MSKDIKDIERTVFSADIKPSDVIGSLMDSVWQNSEKETIARNILLLSKKKNNDTWMSFTWDEYVGFCTHQVTLSEKNILNKFVDTGYLVNQDGVYGFTAKIIGVYSCYC